MKKYGFICGIARGMCLVLICSACSSSTESTIQQVLGITAESPVFLSCKAVSPREITFQFSIPVKVLSLHFDPAVAFDSITDGDMVKIDLTQDLSPGIRITADMVVEDRHRNTLNVLVPFSARNDRFPSLIITELRTEYSKPKVEFVEFKILKPGNLGALRLFIASNGMDMPVFEFPPVEVKTGEYVVIHLRSLEEGIVNATGADLGASQGTEALPEARDFWIPGSKKLLRKTDGVFFMDQDDTILDGVLLSEHPDTWGTKPALAEAAALLDRQKAWLPSREGPLGPKDAVASKATTVTRSICRDETIPNRNRAADWYITVSSGATPGKPNNPKRYVAK
jgi:hypothetical protein